MPADPTLSAHRRPWPHVLAVAVSAVAAVAVLGPIGVLVGVFAAASLTRLGVHTIAGELAAGGAVALVVAALATVVEEPLGTSAIGSAFAVERPVAGGVAAAAGALAIAAVALGWVAVREEEPAGAAAGRREGASPPQVPPAPSSSLTAVGWWLVVPVVLSVAARLALPRADLPAWAAEVAARIRAGTSLTVVVPDGEVAAPGLPFLLALTPDLRALELVLGLVAVLVAATLAQVLAGPRAALGAAAVATVLPSLVVATPATLLAATLVGASTLCFLAGPDGVRGWLLAGLAAAGAIVMAPSSVLLLVAPLVVARRPPPPDLRRLVAFLVPLALAALVLIRFVQATGTSAGALFGLPLGSADHPPLEVLVLELAFGAVALVAVRRTSLPWSWVVVAELYACLALAVGREALWCETALVVAAAAGVSVDRWVTGRPRPTTGAAPATPGAARPPG